MKLRGAMESLLFILLWISTRIVVSLAILDPMDFLALQSIRKSLDDMPGSAFFAAWDFTADPCGFPGVFCAGDRVVTLALGDPRAAAAGLSGRLDPAVGRLSALAELSLVPGRVRGPLPETLSLNPNLRFLALSRNFLSGQIPASFASLRRLHTLDLSFNLLSGEIPTALPAVPAISNLILSHNRLSGQIPAFLKSSQLLHLDLKHNSLSGQIPALPPSLQYLDLSTNLLSGSIPGSVFALPLAALQLQRNAFSGLLRPAAAVVIPVVDLSYNRLSGAVPPELAAAGSLYLNNNRFIGEVPASFSERLLGAGMHLLYLQHNFITGMAIRPAAEIPVSASLCLQYNCMVPPVEPPCPLKAGPMSSRPMAQCPEWRG